LLLRAAFKHGVVFSSARASLKPLRGDRTTARRGVLPSQPAACLCGWPRWFPTNHFTAVSTSDNWTAGRPSPFEVSACV